MIQDKKAWEKRKKFFKKIPDINFKKFDQSHKYNWYEERLEKANELGFKYISQCTVHLYFKYMSYKKVGEKLGMSDGAIQHELRKLGIKMQPRGGYRPKDLRHGRRPRYWNEKVA